MVFCMHVCVHFVAGKGSSCPDAPLPDLDAKSVLHGWQDIAAIVLITAKNTDLRVIWSDELAIPSHAVARAFGELEEAYSTHGHEGQTRPPGHLTWSEWKDPHSRLGQRSRQTFLADALVKFRA